MNMKNAQSTQQLTNTAGFFSRPLIVLLTRDVLLPHQLKGRQTLKVESVPMAETCPLPFAIGWDSRVSAAALVDFCASPKKKKVYIYHIIITSMEI